MCTQCGIAKSYVTETRRVGSEIYRNRRCSACGEKFVSTEYTASDMRMPQEVVQKSLARLHTTRQRKQPPAADKYGATSGFTGFRTLA